MKTKRTAIIIIGITLVVISLKAALTLYPHYNIAGLAGRGWFFYLQLSLPAVVLGIFFYAMFWLEMRPIHALTDHLQTHLEKDDIDGKVTIKATGALSDLVDKFDLFWAKPCCAFTIWRNKRMKFILPTRSFNTEEHLSRPSWKKFRSVFWSWTNPAR